MIRKMLCARPFLSAVVLGSALVALGGCSKSDDGPGSNSSGLVDGGDEDALNYCVNEDDSPEFTQGWTVPGQSSYDVAIQSATPSSPTLGRNTWILAVTNKSDGSPASDVKLKIVCSMVGHSHGCGVTPNITNNGDGTFTIEPLIFNMVKHWNIRVEVTGAEESDYSIFPVCIY